MVSPFYQKVKLHWELNRLRDVLSQQNEDIFMYNVICKRMLSSNHLSVYIFKCHLKILKKYI
jgi:hypothetical protein